jgi:hypothetical protein
LSCASDQLSLTVDIDFEAVGSSRFTLSSWNAPLVRLLSKWLCLLRKQKV